MLRIGLIKTDFVNDDLIRFHGDLPDMFHRFFSAERQVTMDVYEARFGALPDRGERFDALVITGSRYSVNDGTAWVRALLDFIRTRAEVETIVGICFGHQAVCAALGGRVGPRSRGPNVGTHPLTVRERAPWMDPPTAAPRLLYNHGEEVLAPPPGARILAGDATCPTQMVLYRPHVLGLQPHPEYSAAYQDALMALNPRLDAAGLTDARRRNAAGGRDEAILRRWLVGFIESAGRTGGVRDALDERWEGFGRALHGYHHGL